MTQLVFGSRRVPFGHPDRVLFPEDGYSKRDLLEHYLRVAPRFLRHVHRRPVTLQCFPDGIDEAGYFRQQVGEHFPPWLHGARRIRAGDGEIERILCPSRAALAYLVHLDTVTFHAGLARAPRLDRCDRMIFDLDPPGDGFAAVRDAAELLRLRVEALGATAYVMTTGSRGLHVVVPVRPEHDHDAVRAVARGICERLVQAHPGQFTLEQRKAKRGGRLYLDVMRIALGQTAVAPWSLRARPGAPMAMPLHWQELRTRGMNARRWRLADAEERLRAPDPWLGLQRHAVRLSRLVSALED